MALIVWSLDLSVNVQEIDHQHQKLVQMLNELHDSMTKTSSKETLAPVLKGLVDYAVVHFGFEESYFDRFDYPDKEAHKREHRDFIKKVVDFRKEFDSGRLLISMELMDFLKNWLVNHIQGTDKKYGPFLNSKGVR